MNGKMQLKKTHYSRSNNSL